MDSVFIFSAEYLFVLPIIILGVYILRRPWREQKVMITFALFAALLTYAIGTIGNYAFFDPRPFVVGHFIPLVPHAPDNGFPSDHTLLVSAIASIGMFWNRRLGIVLWILAIIVAVARVYVGLHHAADVLGSMAIALITVSAVYIAWSRGWFKAITTRL